jgi:hypothetical protein
MLQIKKISSQFVAETLSFITNITNIITTFKLNQND